MNQLHSCVPVDERLDTSTFAPARHVPRSACPSLIFGTFGARGTRPSTNILPYSTRHVPGHSGTSDLLTACRHHHHQAATLHWRNEPGRPAASSASSRQGMGRSSSGHMHEEVLAAPDPPPSAAPLHPHLPSSPDLQGKNSDSYVVVTRACQLPLCLTTSSAAGPSYPPLLLPAGKPTVPGRPHAAAPRETFGVRLNHFTRRRDNEVTTKLDVAPSRSPEFSRRAELRVKESEIKLFRPSLHRRKAGQTISASTHQCG